MTYALVDSPIGPLTLVGEDDALSGLYMHQGRHVPDVAGFGQRDDAAHPAARRQLAEYFAGERQQFTVPLRPRGSEFQRTVWSALAEIPYGQTCSYGELTARLGLTPQAVRAVAGANGRNPISILVPCHRVIGADGRLTGYAGGLPRKQFLLDLERPPAAREQLLF
ncbi:methylated-DNA--[protein]-cysteine S-methyltransferase [Georgenia yuyongxinii]|uniref:Methylated-DNA--protein-cysteine methyltransferase n=1 Tax=Georgenia yuyongxinii TaxID=2589797 RepID=A0A5B8CAR8_9MICO|nr:methylated-DNA--[protein]-cysteine S-methyltransferase [Georgenia yuyongxinii]QDC26352.1 methylated-DNA--[protein]-cysteine S-methyltransferase [Georgenia yuyongxinii]